MACYQNRSHGFALGNICGRGSFTGQDGQGVLLDIDCMDVIGANPDGLETFAHEMGHYFDLLHTHETKFGVECPSGNNCSTAADLLCDTPADPELLDDNLISRVNADCSSDNSATAPAKCDDTP